MATAKSSIPHHHPRHSRADDGKARAFSKPPAEEADWKAAVRKDVEDRFGPTPDDLVPVGEVGW